MARLARNRSLFAAALLAAAAVILIPLALAPAAARADYPQPSIYPITWEFNFSHGLPKRIAVDVGPGKAPQAFWYLPYTITNKTGQERSFLPNCEMVTQEGKVIRSDNATPLQAFQAIQRAEGNRLLVNPIAVAGELRLGEDEAKDSVAIWPEPETRMGRFTLYIGGLSGETATVKGPDGNGILLRKTLQLNYFINGDEVYPGEDKINENPQAWVMR